MIHKDIFIKYLNIDDIYTGKYAMSDGNKNHIYMLKKSDGQLYHKCQYKVLNREFPQLATIEVISNSDWKVVYSDTKWIETTLTRKLNLEFEREMKLNQLLFQP